ncbi:TonB family protein [Candidatus Sumerlaeota bacterium]|nr:TonB family protein [Candidatus Sumerlaeota bacterium]
MLRMTIFSLMLHTFVILLLVFASWYNARPIPKQQTQTIRIVTPPTPEPVRETPRVTPKTPRATPTPTPEPEKTKTPTPTPKPEKTKTPTPKPEKTKTPTPKPEKTKTPTPTPQALPKNLKPITTVMPKRDEPTPTPEPARTIPPDLKPLTNVTPLPDKPSAEKVDVKASIMLPSYYIVEARKMIRDNFTPPIHKKGTVCVVEFTILPDEDGTITSVGILQSTGNRQLDDAALDAMRITGSLHRLPDDIRARKQSVRASVTFSFD